MPRILTTAFVLLLLATTSRAESTDMCAAASGASDVQFTLAIHDGRAVFQSGEIIPLDLSFTSSARRYWADDRKYDRSGRLDIETYCLEPEAPDPLAAYFHQGAFIGGGIYSTRALSAEPFIAHVELNEWLQPAPGRYRLYAVSQRAWRSAEPQDKSPDPQIHIVLRSNSVEFQVLPPNAKWQQAQVASAVDTLSGLPTPEAAGHAARVLRYLATRESTRALARLFGGRDLQSSPQFDLMLGLFSSPYPDLAIRSMRAEFAVPTHAITRDFLSTLVRLQVLSDPAWALPGGQVPAAFWEQSRAHTQELTRTEVQELAARLPRKTGAARALTLDAMLMSDVSDPALLQSIRPALIESWKDLPAETQQDLLKYRWPLIAGPDMLPVLRGILQAPHAPAYTEQSDLRGSALKHILELDPGEGREQIRQDLLNPRANPRIELIQLLPSEEIQSAVAPAAERIRTFTGRPFDFELVDRYADTSALPALLAAFEEELGKGGCDPESHLLRYFLRVSPEYGAQQVRAVLAARKGCYRSVLLGIGDQLPNAQQVAIEALNDPDPEVVLSAVGALGSWGTPDAEEPLWTRLERFHQEWAAHKSELIFGSGPETPGTLAFRLERALSLALSSGRGWICPPEKLAHLAQLVLTRYDKHEIEVTAGEWRNNPHQISSGWFPEDKPTFTVLRYSDLSEDQLRAKLEQFPRGTRFEWMIWLPGQIAPPVPVAAQQAVFERMRSAAESHGIVLLEKKSEP